MNAITTTLQRQVLELTENLQDAVMLARKHKNNMGQIDQQELDRLNAKANGKAFNEKDWDTSDRNGEQ
jgi:hypothetical protein